MKFTTIFAAAAAIFAGFVAASPVAAPNAVAVASPVSAGNELVTRGDADVEEACLKALVQLEVDIIACNKKYTDICSKKKCGYDDIKAYQLEVALIIKAVVDVLKAKIFVGLKLVKVQLFIDICLRILVSINVTLNVLCKGLGLLGFLLVKLVVDLCVDLSISLKALIAVLAICIPDLLVIIKVNLGGLIGALLCLVCSILNIL